jgi:hypothetical protein
MWFQEPMDRPGSYAVHLDKEPDHLHPMPKGGGLPTIMPVKSPFLHKLAFAASLVVFCMMLSFVYGHTILSAMPWLSGYYAKIGVMDYEGIGMTAVEIEQVKEGKELKLVLKGRFVNTTDKEKYIPSLRIAIYNQNNKKVVSSVEHSEGALIKAGGEVYFYQVIPDVPLNAAKVELDMGDKLALILR